MQWLHQKIQSTAYAQNQDPALLFSFSIIYYTQMHITIWRNDQPLFPLYRDFNDCPSVCVQRRAAAAVKYGWAVSRACRRQSWCLRPTSPPLSWESPNACVLRRATWGCTPWPPISNSSTHTLRPLSHNTTKHPWTTSKSIDTQAKRVSRVCGTFRCVLLSVVWDWRDIVRCYCFTAHKSLGC